jgi:hypothetical protein
MQKETPSVMISITEKYFSCTKKSFPITDTNLNQTYSGTVGVKNNIGHEKMYILIFWGAETNYLISYMNDFLNLTPIFSVNFHLSE